MAEGMDIDQQGPVVIDKKIFEVKKVVVRSFIKILDVIVSFCNRGMP